MPPRTRCMWRERKVTSPTPWLVWPSATPGPPPCRARLLHTSGITLGLSRQSRRVGETVAQQAKHRGMLVSLDVNYRSRLWDTRAAADAVRSIAPAVDIVICTAEDARDLFEASGPPEEVARRLQEMLDIETVVLTLGGAGALALEGGSVHVAS